LLQTEWGLGERLAVRGLIPYRDIRTSGRFDFDGSGLGDIEGWALWRLGPEGGRSGGVVGGGLAFPTGKSVPRALTNENVFFGVGNYSLLASIEGHHQLGGSLQVFGLVRYRLPLGAGNDGYRFGDDLGWTTILRWQPRGGPLGLTVGISGQHLGVDEQNGAPVPNRGGRLHYASVGASIPLGGRVTLSALSQWLVEQDVRGDQLLAPWQMVTGLTWSWGAHEHSEGHEETGP
jgi:hypothetical protein